MFGNPGQEVTLESSTAAAQATDGASEQEQPDQPKRRRRRQPQRQAQKRPPQPPTQYVILQRLKVDRSAIREEDTISYPGTMIDAWTLLYEDQPPGEGESKPLIIETAGGDKRAIKLATKLDDEAQRPGTYRAVPLRNWTGTLTFRNATKTVTETEESED